MTKKGAKETLPHSSRPFCLTRYQEAFQLTPGRAKIPFIKLSQFQSLFQFQSTVQKKMVATYILPQYSTKLTQPIYRHTQKKEILVLLLGFEPTTFQLLTSSDVLPLSDRKFNLVLTTLYTLGLKF